MSKEMNRDKKENNLLFLHHVVSFILKTLSKNITQRKRQKDQRMTLMHIYMCVGTEHEIDNGIAVSLNIMHQFFFSFLFLSVSKLVFFLQSLSSPLSGFFPRVLVCIITGYTT